VKNGWTGYDSTPAYTLQFQPLLFTSGIAEMVRSTIGADIIGDFLPLYVAVNILWCSGITRPTRAAIE
jgi:hypothetical protein